MPDYTPKHGQKIPHSKGCSFICQNTKQKKNEFIDLKNENNNLLWKDYYSTINFNSKIN